MSCDQIPADTVRLTKCFPGKTPHRMSKVHVNIDSRHTDFPRKQ